MGCVSSRKDINDVHPNIFQVMNVDELGQLVSPGQLELTEAELVLYQKGKTATRWPLRCLRRYGFDAEIFSFESGRRCPTGPGIYAFRCQRAEQLFNLLQHYIHLRNLSDEIVSAAGTDCPIPAVTAGPIVATRQASLPIEQGYLDPNRTAATHFQNTRFARPSSVMSNGPISPSTVSPPPTADSVLAEHNNNKRSSLQVQHSYTNTIPLSLDAPHSVQQPYMNIDPTISPTPSSSSEPHMPFTSDVENCHLYMNVTPGEVPTTPLLTPDSMKIPDEKLEEDPKHCYANLEPGEIEALRPIFSDSTLPPHTPPGVTREVNYIVLDLDQSKPETVAAASQASQQPDSPRKPAEGYATIDFNKTVALLHSVNPCLDLDSEGSRKTRHNSTISELTPVPSRHSNSLSD